MSAFRRLCFLSKKVVPKDGCVHAVYQADAATTSKVIYSNGGGIDWVSVDGVRLASPTTAVALTAGTHDVACHVKSGGGSLYNCFYKQPVTSISFASLGDNVGVTDMYQFASECSKLTSVDFGEWKGAGLWRLALAFYNSGALAELSGIGGIDTSAVTNLNTAFLGVPADLSGIASWFVPLVTDISHAFAWCSSEVIDMEGWGCTTALTTMEEAFRNNSKLKVVKMPRTLDPTSVNFNMAFLATAALTTVYVPSEYMDAYKTAMSNGYIDLTKLTAY